VADAVLALALRLLGRRDHSLAELRAKLSAKGCATDAIDRVSARLLELGYLNDARLAERLARTYAASGRGVGRRLVLELRKRGLPADLAQAATTAARHETDEVAIARGLVTRRYPTFSATADLRERRRVVAFLQRRGFTMTTIRAVLNFADISAIEGTDDW
jgi:regulatory protein